MLSKQHLQQLQVRGLQVFEQQHLRQQLHLLIATHNYLHR